MHASQGLGGLHAIQAGHLKIHQHRVVAPLPAHVRGLTAIFGHIHLGAQGPQQLGRHQLVDWMVLRQQQPQAIQPGSGWCRRTRWHVMLRRHRHRQPHGEPKGRPLPELAVHADLAPHQPHQLARDGQTQARAAMPAGRRVVQLFELLEQAGLVFGSDAHTRIAHREAQQHAIGLALQQLHRQHHLALVGELHRVVAQVDQHLPQAQGVAQQPGRHGGVEPAAQAQLLALRRLADEGLHPAEHHVQRKGFGGQRHSAGVGLAQVQDVVDDGQQMAAGLVQLPHMGALPAIQGGLQQQVAEAVDGIERGADLMAHVGQEGRLGLGGTFRGLLGLGQGLVGGQQLAGALHHAGFQVFVAALQGLGQGRHAFQLAVEAGGGGRAHHRAHQADHAVQHGIDAGHRRLGFHPTHAQPPDRSQARQAQQGHGIGLTPTQHPARQNGGQGHQGPGGVAHPGDLEGGHRRDHHQCHGEEPGGPARLAPTQQQQHAGAGQRPQHRPQPGPVQEVQLQALQQHRRGNQQPGQATDQPCTTAQGQGVHRQGLVHGVRQGKTGYRGCAGHSVGLTGPAARKNACNWSCSSLFDINEAGLPDGHA